MNTTPRLNWFKTIPKTLLREKIIIDICGALR